MVILSRLDLWWDRGESLKLCLKFKLTEPTLFSEVQENCMDRLLKGDKVLQVYQDYLDSKEFDLIWGYHRLW